MIRRCSCFFFFKQKTAYELRISDWSSDVCSSDLLLQGFDEGCNRTAPEGQRETVPRFGQRRIVCDHRYLPMGERLGHRQAPSLIVAGIDGERARPVQCRQFAVGRIVNPYDMCLERRVALEARK